MREAAMRRMARWLLGGVLALVAATAMGVVPDGAASGRTTSATPTAEAARGLPYISVVEALTAPYGEPVHVHGFLVVADGEVRLCQALTRSLPPRCAGTSLLVHGLNLTGLPLVNTGGTMWSTAPQDLIGTVSEGILTVALRLG
jgi:hypothetical protein